MDYSFSKDKLPRGLSYPLKRSTLDSALSRTRLGSDLHAVIYSYSPRRAPAVILADYTGEDHRGAGAAGQTGLWVLTVPSAERAAVAASLEKDGLPRLVAWLSELRAGANVLRGPSHRFIARWAEGALTVEAPLR